jgi:hypothetical protein
MGVFVIRNQYGVLGYVLANCPNLVISRIYFVNVSSSWLSITGKYCSVACE